MRYGTGLNEHNEDSGLCADITGADVLSDLVYKATAKDWVVASCLASASACPDHLKDGTYGKFLGTLILQSADGTDVSAETVYLLDDGDDTRPEDDILLKMLKLDSAGTGVVCKINPLMHSPAMIEVHYYTDGPDGPDGEGVRGRL